MLEAEDTQPYEPDHKFSFAKACLNFIKPDIVKLLLFAVFSCVFLIVKNKIFSLPANQSCPLAALNNTYTGLPFSYYSYDRLENSQFDILNLLLNIFLYYVVSCMLVGYIRYGIKSIRSNRKNSRLVFVSITINLMVIAFVSINFMASDWLVNSVRTQKSYTANILLLLGTSPDSVSFKNRYHSLHEAVRHDNAYLTNLLLDYGASPNKVDDTGKTALHIATSRNAVHAAEVLLRAGINPNARDQNGKTAAHFACTPTMAKLLVRHNVNPNIGDKNEKRPEDLAEDLQLKNYWASKSDPGKARAIKKVVAATPNKDLATKAVTIAPENKDKPTLKKLKAKKSIANCTHSISGTLFAQGKQYSITTDNNGIITAYSGVYGFAYAECPKKGYYHIMVQTADRKPSLYLNLVPEKGETPALSFANKQTVLIKLSIVTDVARISWYFSSRKIENLLKAIEQGNVSEIGINKLKVRPVATKKELTPKEEK